MERSPRVIIFITTIDTDIKTKSLPQKVTTLSNLKGTTEYEELIQLHRIAMTLLEPLPYDIRHLLREHTTKADELANRGVDRKKALPLKVLDTLNKYGFEL